MALVACRRSASVAPDPAPSVVTETGTSGVARAQARWPRRRIAVGDDFACAVRDMGTVWCWGNNDKCALAQPWGGGVDSRPTPVRVDLPLPSVAVSAGRDWACAVLEDESVRCWGSGTITGTHDAEAHKTNDCSPGLVAVDGVLSLRLEGRNACAVTRKGLRCWGEAHVPARGTCGPPPASGFINAAPAAVVAPCGVPVEPEEVADVDFSARELCVLSVAGKVTCVSSIPTEDLPAKFGSVEQRSPHLRAISLYGDTTARCAIATSGQFGCWRAPLGSGASAYHHPWLPLPRLDAVAAVDGSLVVSDRGEVRSFALDVRATGPALSSGPTTIDVPAADEIAAGPHSCARALDGAIWCWGSDNASGVLGAPIGVVPPRPRKIAFPTP